MTDDEQQMLRDVSEKASELHAFLFESPPGLPGNETRAQQIERLLQAYRAGSFVARIALWGAGAITTVGAAYIMLRQGR